ncbi:MAG: hypothetical protein R3F43_01360 [bacterium]
MRTLPLLCLLPGAALAGPWTRDAGQVYAKASQSIFVADAYRDATGQLQGGVDYLGVTTSAYVELGLVDGLHLQLYLPHTAATNAVSANGNRYLSAGGGDAQFGLQARLPLGFPAAVRGVIKAPLYDVGAIPGRDAMFFPQRGDGQIDATITLSAGHAFGDLPLYLFGEVGHQWRTSRFVGAGADVSYGDGLSWAAQVGWTILPGVGVALGAGGVVPYAEDAVTKGYTSVGPAVYIPLASALALEVGYDEIVLARNSAKGRQGSVGISFNLQ